MRRRKRGREEGRKGGSERGNAGRSPGKDAAGKAVRMQHECSELCDCGSEGKEGRGMEERGGTEGKDGRGCAPARALLTMVQRARKAKAASDKAAKARRDQEEEVVEKKQEERGGRGAKDLSPVADAVTQAR
jgi:hypothetical protein